MHRTVNTLVGSADMTHVAKQAAACPL